MTSKSSSGLLTSRDAGPVRITNFSGSSLFLLLGDHAGNLVPERLAGLGIGPDDLHRHIALDIGVSELGSQLSAKLGAPFIEQRYSRLVIDCNRAVEDPGSIARVSDGTAIPGNAGLSPPEFEDRVAEIFRPYHRAISGMLAKRQASSLPARLVSLHSFTPQLAGLDRPWEIGVLYSGGDRRFALAVLKALRSVRGLIVGDNEPYRMDETDFTIPHNAFGPAIPYVEIEIRQDRLSEDNGVGQIAGILAQALLTAGESIAA